MCHTSSVVTGNEQIDKCIEGGMPHKIIKTLKFTMKKRAAAEEEEQQKMLQQVKNKEEQLQQQQQQKQHITDIENFHAKHQSTNQTNVAGAGKSIRKCPFFNGTLKLGNNTQPAATSTFVNPLIANLSDHKMNDNELLLAAATAENADILAKGTQLTRKYTHRLQQTFKQLQSTKTYTFLTKTAQPAHIVAICTISFVLLSVWPELIDGGSSKGATSEKLIHNDDDDDGGNHNRKNKNTLALIAYLGSFATHFGAQIWMTFVSGLSLYFSLPRHMFGQCQQILFPKYFALNAVLSITMLILYVKFFISSWTLQKCLQLGALALTGAIELAVRLYLAPPLLVLMLEKYKIEDTIGSGKEIGSLVQGDLVQCPHYQRIHKAFRRIHMTVAIGNVITMLASCFHLYYLASQIQISI